MSVRTRLALGFVGAVCWVGCGGDGGAPDAGPAVDQCVGAADMAVIATITPVAPDGGGDAGVDPVPGWLSACTLMGGECSSVVIGGSDDEVRACMHSCLAPTPLGELSEGCRLCYIDTVTCARAHCVLPCLGTDPVACAACTGTYCTPAFDACRGL